MHVTIEIVTEDKNYSDLSLWTQLTLTTRNFTNKVDTVKTQD